MGISKISLQEPVLEWVMMTLTIAGHSFPLTDKQSKSDQESGQGPVMVWHFSPDPTLYLLNPKITLT